MAPRWPKRLRDVDGRHRPEAQTASLLFCTCPAHIFPEADGLTYHSGLIGYHPLPLLPLKHVLAQSPRWTDSATELPGIMLWSEVMVTAAGVADNQTRPSRNTGSLLHAPAHSSERHPFCGWLALRASRIEHRLVLVNGELPEGRTVI